MPDRETIHTLEDLQEKVYAFRVSRILLSAFELGVFTALENGARTSEQVAKLLKSDSRATDRLLNALCVLGLLKKTGRLFVNRTLAARYLAAGSPNYLAGLAHSASMWQSWSTLTAAVRHGGTVLKGRGRRGDKARTRSFIAAMHWRATRQAEKSLRLLDLSRVRRSLDIGAGSGAYSMALARLQPKLQATLFDLPEVIPLAKKYAAAAGLARRFRFLRGDFRRDPFGSGYDLILLSAIIHMNSPAANRRLFAKAAAALNPGGLLVIQDFIMSRNRTRPALGAFFALNMLVGTATGDTFTAGEVRQFFRHAGLVAVRKMATPFGSALMVGRKK